MLPGLRRARGDAAAPRGRRRARAGDPAHRQGRGIRSVVGPPSRRRRLRRQAVLARSSWSRGWRRSCAGRLARRRRQEEPLRFDELEIDPSTRRVVLRERDVELTEREFDLLHFLARHPDQVFSRDQLMDRVWQFAFYTDTTTVTVHVRRLRAKIEEDAVEPPLDRDRVGRGLPLPGAGSMKRSALIAAAAGVLVAAIVGPVYGAEPALVTAGLVAGLSVAGLAAAHRFASQRPLRPLQLRFDIVVGTAVGVILVTVLAAAELMFVSNHDALMISAIALAAALVALRAARVASAGVVEEVGELRDVLARRWRGRARLPCGGGCRDRARRARRRRELDDRAAGRGGAAPRRGGRRPAQPRRRDLPRPAHADDRAPAHGRRDRGRPRRRGHARSLPRHDAYPRQARSAR